MACFIWVVATADSEEKTVVVNAWEFGGELKRAQGYFIPCFKQFSDAEEASQCAKRIDELFDEIKKLMS